MALKLYPKMQLELARAVRRAYRELGSVRAAAKSLGMPRSTFHDLLTGKGGRR
ncbi:MAG TPA: hypothetical protein VIV58_22595 [Kofleriaceae bacterium]